MKIKSATGFMQKPKQVTAIGAKNKLHACFLYARVCSSKIMLGISVEKKSRFSPAFRKLKQADSVYVNHYTLVYKLSSLLEQRSTLRDALPAKEQWWFLQNFVPNSDELPLHQGATNGYRPNQNMFTQPQQLMIT